MADPSTQTRRCRYRKCGGPIPVTARADAGFCCPEHKSAHHNEERRVRDATAKRLDPASAREGSRGGNVRDLNTARELQDAQPEKAQWADAIDEQIRRTLTAAGEIHANDLDELGVPAAHCNLIGTRIAWHRNKRFIAATGELRKVTHKAANGRKTSVYRLTHSGRNWLAGVGGANREGTSGSGASPEPSTDPTPGARSSSTADPGETSSADLTGAAEESARLFELPERRRSALTDPEWGSAA